MNARLLPFCFAIAACTQGEPASKNTPVVVTVNGLAITEADVQLGLKASGHGTEASPAERRKALISGLIHDELLRQKAVELGLEPEGAAADEVTRLKTQLSAARRRALAEAYFKQLAKKAEPTDAQAREFFEKNQALLRSEYRLSQILLRDEAQITRAHEELLAGATFEDVARRQFPGLPDGVGLPWELGALGWKQLPDPWRPVLETLAPGQSSGVIRGPGNRFWIIKLIERRFSDSAL